MFTEETLKILVPLFTAMLGYAVGYFVKKSEYERQRKDELADKDYKRRASINEMRIKEARDYLDTYLDIIERITNLEGTLMEEITGKALSPILMQPVDDKVRAYQKIIEALNNARGKRMSIPILNDLELKEQNHGLALLVANELTLIGNAIAKNSEMNSDKDPDSYLARVLAFNQRAELYVEVMQTILDELAHKFK